MHLLPYFLCFALLVESVRTPERSEGFSPSPLIRTKRICDCRLGFSYNIYTSQTKSNLLLFICNFECATVLVFSILSPVKCQ